MKKITALILTLVMVLTSMSVFAASTATSVYNEEKSTATDQYFTTSGKIENGGNGFVTLLVTTDGSVSVDNIMYIDQTAADVNGNFSFTDYIPKINVPAGKKYVVKVGATSLTKAIDGGYLEIPLPKGHTVTGTVSSQGTTNVTINIKKDGSVVANSTIQNGAFSFDNIEDGSYQVVVAKKGHLPALTTLTVSGVNVVMKEVKLLAGDLVSDDKEIGINDLSKVIGLYGVKTGETGYNVDFDINDDGEIGITELSAIIGNYGEKADPACYE